MTARTHDYLWLLVDASAWALFSALVTEICVKFKQGGQAWFWAACFFGSALVAAYCLVKFAVKSGMTELEQALGARAECVGTSGFTTREDVLLATASPAALQIARQVKGA